MAKAVKNTLGGSVGSRQREAHRVGINFGNRHRLAVDDQQIALRGIDRFVHVNGEGKEHVVGIEWMAVREANPFAELKREGAAVRRCLP